MQRTNDRTQRANNLLRILKKKSNGFTGLINGLLKEKYGNFHVVQKLKDRRKKFQTHKPQKKELPPSTSQTEIKHLYQRLLKLIKGTDIDVNNEPEFEDFDKLLDDIQKLRQTLSRADDDKVLEMVILLKRTTYGERRTETKR